MKQLQRTLLLSACLTVTTQFMLSAQQTKSISHRGQNYLPVFCECSCDTAGYAYSFSGDSCKAIYNYMQSRQRKANNTSTVKPPDNVEHYYLKSKEFYGEDY
jgi:hypothetical protein